MLSRLTVEQRQSKSGRPYLWIPGGLILQNLKVESEVEGDIDLHGFLGLREDVKRGYQGIRMRFKIKADASDEQLQDIVKIGPTFSPVFDSITKAVTVKISAAR